VCTFALDGDEENVHIERLDRNEFGLKNAYLRHENSLEHVFCQSFWETGTQDLQNFPMSMSKHQFPVMNPSTVITVGLRMVQ